MSKRITVDAAPRSAPVAPFAERAARLPEPATVHGMLPDFRFVLGAVVAIALLGVAGLGLVTSTRLVREAHMGPLDDTRSLAFAGHAEWNQFYDPEAARRFAGLSGATESKTESPIAQARPQAPAEEPEPASTEAQERTASIPAPRGEPEIADDKPLAAAPITPPLTESPAVVTVAAAPVEAPSASAPSAPTSEASVSDAPAPDAPPTTRPEPPPAERVASAPAAPPEPELPREIAAPTAMLPQTATQEPTVAPTPTPTLIPAQPQAADSPLQDSAPTRRARPKIHFRKRVARAHIRHIDAVVQQPQQNSGFPAPWPGYDNPINGAPAAGKNASKLVRAPANRPQ
jgi:hypothetical protein